MCASSSKGKLPELIIGTAGHVDHGKTTLVQAITGVWTARHSEELRRGLTMKLGYAIADIYECEGCEWPYRFASHTMLKDGKCAWDGTAKFRRRISFIDVPGHETLMATMIAGATLMDAALLVIDASVPCPQPQTYEHFMALTIMGIRNLIVVQNKIDVVADKEKLIKHYKQIKEFLKGTWAEDAPIIPVSALHKVNIEALIDAIETRFKTPKRDLTKPPRFLIARSFNVNRPGTRAEELKGGVIGGSLVQGRLRVGDEIEIRPGIRIVERGKVRYEPLYTEVRSIMVGNEPLEEALPGALVGIGTDLDPALTRADMLMGNVAGKPGTLPPTRMRLTLDVHLFERVILPQKQVTMQPIRPRETIMLIVGTAMTWGVVTSAKKDRIEVVLKKPVVAEDGAKVAITRQVMGRWRLAGYGIVVA